MTSLHLFKKKTGRAAPAQPIKNISYHSSCESCYGMNEKLNGHVAGASGSGVAAFGSVLETSVGSFVIYAS